MTRPGPKKNLAASIRDRLIKLARSRREDFNFLLTRYAMERLGDLEVVIVNTGMNCIRR